MRAIATLIILLFTSLALAGIKPKSGRWLTAHEKLLANKDIPQWYIDLDKDNDGQVSMSEWCKPNEWTTEKVAEFEHYDLNHDGIITPTELVKVIKQDEAKAKSKEKKK